MNCLNEVRCLYNTGTVSVIELTTDYGKKIIKVPYQEIENQQGGRYDYKLSIADFCETMDICYYKYFMITRPNALKRNGGKCNGKQKRL